MKQIIMKNPAQAGDRGFRGNPLKRADTYRIR